MHSLTTLLLLQTASLTLSAMLCLVLLLSRFHQAGTSREYEVQRWLLALAMLILTVHYALQICCGFRAHDADVGAVINILFYSPVTYLISFSIVSIGCGPGYKRRHGYASFASLTLIIGSFLWGYLRNGSLHIGSALYAMGTFFFLTMLGFIIYPIREINRVSKQIDEESGELPVQYNIYMRTGHLVLDLVAIIVPFSIFCTRVIIFVGPLCLLTLLFFVISFVALGFHSAHFRLTPAESEPACAVREPRAPRADVGQQESVVTPQEDECGERSGEQIGSAIEAWLASGGFSASDLNSAVLASRLGISRRQLVEYLRYTEGKTFRVWLSDIRIDHAKRLIVEHPEYSNEAIADACGFSRGYFQNKFKAATGFTPSDWRNAAQSHASDPSAG